ncbi:MAG TPA: pyruvate dehydrogenase complex dihydrolipoamide acetyltransferase [Candidatus Tectomicrobia bacterium]|nr:pyruvate dehydrogenase complex dihydrolipoamide acetyltransferase [Candidatus Tectomicrobia bacterium]
MATQIVMPKMSETMEEGVVVKWLKREGDRVATGDALAEIETDKAVLELEATTPGVLRQIVAQEDSKVPVGQLIAVIAAADEDISPLVVGSTSPSSQASPALTTPPAATPTATPAMASPAAASPARHEAATRERIDASPLARRMAEEAGIDIAQIRGTGPGGRVVKRDIEAFLAQSRGQPSQQPTPPVAPSPAAAAAPTPHDEAARLEAGAPDYVEQELNMMRKTIARRMALSKTTAPHFYLTTEIDMARAISLRQSLNELAVDEARVSLNDMIVKAVANALRQFPRLNVSYADDKLRQHRRVHISVAVAIDEGLITPVIRDCDRKSLGEIARESKELTERARARRLKPEDYTGGTFSISNLGMYDVEDFGAIINPPEAAILAVGAVKERAVVVDGQLGIGQRMKLTLSCDHRAVDGATAAQFLQIVKRLLEHPLTLML